MVGAQHQQCVVELARHRQRPPAGACPDDLPEIAGNLVTAGTGDGQGRDALVRLDVDFDPAVTIAALADHALEREESNAHAIGRAIAAFSPSGAALLDNLPQARWWRGAVYQSPGLSPTAAHPLDGDAKDLSSITP